MGEETAESEATADDSSMSWKRRGGWGTVACHGRRGGGGGGAVAY